MKKIYINILLFLSLILLNGCTSVEYKEDLMNKKLDELYENYSIIDSCSYSDESVNDELESIVKIKDEYVLASIDVRNKKISNYIEERLFSHKSYNNYMVITEIAKYSDSMSLIIFIDNSLDKNHVSKYLTDFCLNYAETNDTKQFFIDIYYVKDFNKNKEIYKEFAISQCANRCNYNFFNKYKEKVGIINKQNQYAQFLPTKNDEAYKNNYKEYIKENVAKLINAKSK